MKLPANYKGFGQMIDKPLIIFDLETTDADINTAKIIQFGAVKYYPDSHNHTPETFNLLVNPGIPILNSDIHGITDEMVQGKPFIADVADTVAGYFAGTDIAGYNIIRFDLPILLRELNASGRDVDYEHSRLIDAYKIWTNPTLFPRTLGAAHEFWRGIPIEDAHDAVGDSLATGNVLIGMANKIEGMTGFIFDDAEAWEQHSVDRNKMVDLAGHFMRNDDGELVFNFGKHKGKQLREEKSYLDWMLNGGFPDDTKSVIRAIQGQMDFPRT